MADEIPREDVTPDLRTDPNKILDRQWLVLMIWENCEEVVELIRPILKKSLGLNPMTEEEHALTAFFKEEAQIVIDHE